MRTRSISLASMLLAVTFASAAVRGQPVQATAPLPSVTTTGTASVFVVPDEVELRFTITTTNREVAKAKSENDAAAKDVIDFLTAQGVDAKDVQATYVTTEAIYAETPLGNGQITRGPLTGYNIRRDYGVTLRDVSKLAAVYDKLLPDARVTTNGHTFKSSKDREQRDTARRDAAKAAREKAKLLAEALDAKLGSVRTIAEGNVGPIYPMPMVNALRMSAGDGGSGPATPIGQIEIRAEVTATFDLIQP